MRPACRSWVRRMREEDAFVAVKAADTTFFARLSPWTQESARASGAVAAVLVYAVVYAYDGDICINVCLTCDQLP